MISDSVAAARAEESAEEESAEEPASAAEDDEDGDREDEGGPVYEAARFEVEIIVDKDRPEGVLALTGARLITMRGDEVIERGDIVIRDNRIVAVGPSGSVDIPSGADVRDMSGRTIYPGLVDIHAHTWVAWGVHRSQISQFLAQLAYGVTTQRDPQTSSEDVVTYSDLMETGEFIGHESSRPVRASSARTGFRAWLRLATSFAAMPTTTTRRRSSSISPATARSDSG